MKRLVDPPASANGGLTDDALPGVAVPAAGGARAEAGGPRPGAVGACLLVVLPVLLLVLAGGAPEAAAKPNIVLIVVDDMEVGLVGHMPVVKERIVDQGATFTRVYFNNPLCCPSRATILTGRYAQNTGVTQNSHELFHANDNPARTVAVWLKAAGYRTALVGK